MKGYHLSWKNNKNSIENKITEHDEYLSNDLASNDEHSSEILKDVNNIYITKKNEDFTGVKVLKPKPSSIIINSKKLKNNNEDCDLIILNNGDDISVKVVEITQSEIKYKKCDNLNGPIYSITKSEVFTIRYSNGSKEIIKQSTTNKSDNTPNDISNSKEINKTSTSEKSQTVALLLCLFIFIGLAGIHRFYLGYPVEGIIMLLTLGGCGIWALIDLIRILSGSLKPKDNEYKTKL